MAQNQQGNYVFFDNICDHGTTKVTIGHAAPYTGTEDEADEDFVVQIVEEPGKDRVAYNEDGTVRVIIPTDSTPLHVVARAVEECNRILHGG